MKKISFLFVIGFLFLGLSTSNAQVKLILSGGVQVPTGDFKTVSDVGYGGSVDAEFNLPVVGPTFFATAGYNRFSITNTSYNYSIIPLMGGVKYFFGTPGGLATFYFGGALGIAVLNSNIPLSSSESKFIWSPSVGIRLSNFDVNARYHSFSSGGVTFSWFGLNVGFIIGR